MVVWIVMFTKYADQGGFRMFTAHCNLGMGIAMLNEPWLYQGKLPSSKQHPSAMRTWLGEVAGGPAVWLLALPLLTSPLAGRGGGGGGGGARGVL